jgi:TadE-like protein
VDEVDQMKQTATRQKKAVGRLPMQAARQAKTAESGQTLIEFAFLLPFLMLLLLGIAEIGRAAFITIKVTNAATAGVEFGSQNSANASNFNAMQLHALCDANGDLGFSMGSCSDGILTLSNTVATNGCVCDDSGSGKSCNASTDPWLPCPTISCGSGQQIVVCVQVTTHADFAPLFHFPGLPTTYQANGKAIMRVRQ